MLVNENIERILLYAQLSYSWFIFHGAECQVNPLKSPVENLLKLLFVQVSIHAVCGDAQLTQTNVEKHYIKYTWIIEYKYTHERTHILAADVFPVLLVHMLGRTLKIFPENLLKKNYYGNKIWLIDWLIDDLFTIAARQPRNKQENTYK